MRRAGRGFWDRTEPQDAHRCDSGGGRLAPAVVRAQRLELLAGGYLQADETTMPCQTGEKTGRNHRAYIWEFSEPGGRVVFEFQMGRGREGPREFLQGFRGKLQSDGYGAYDKLGEGIVYVGCMAHARRGFVDAAKVAPLDPVPREILERFAELYAVEKEAREGGLGAEARLALRQAKSVPVMAALKTRLVEIRQQITPGGKLAQACDYALGQWSRLEEYLKDGRIEIDNNWCEGAIRPLGAGTQELAAHRQPRGRTEDRGHRLDRGNLPPPGHQSARLPPGRASQTGRVAHQPGGRADPHRLEGRTSQEALTSPQLTRRQPAG